MTLNILIVGDSPSKLNKDPNVPFIGAKCEKRLRSWLEYLQLNWNDCIFINSTDKDAKYKVQNLLKKNYNIIALGNKASNFLNYKDHFKLPHPSGLNRKLNDKVYEKKMLDNCKEWLYSNTNE